jgi:hypothetical protein
MLGGGPHRGMAGGGVVSMNAGTEEQPRSRVMRTKGNGGLGDTI